ncbi:metallophosphoesterase [Bacillus mojavensis]|uniref:metallophosphoesterase n=1 Tax=Bacillus mojavensis TaxID=72360 RepID=UPI002DB5D819|nr:metallophosphoesterase [Bacillus mojavensis]MEC1621957.1 metallophosphoesterase [Bacillus mojavensis]MEC1660610.1 metallophosphoesterase [Bacillus mojavensis]
MKRSMKIAGALAIAAAAMTAKMYSVAKGNHLKNHTFRLSKMKGKPPLTIFFISDIHKRIVDHGLLEEAQGHGPDLVIIGGDLAEGGVSCARIEENVRRLAGLGVPVMFVWGNNDYEVSLRELYSIFKAYRIITLRNESVPFTYNGHTIIIAGVDDIRMEMDDYEEAIKEIDGNQLNVLVCHNPEIHQQINENDGIDVIFSGHTHGGQIRFGKFGPYELGTTGFVKNAAYLISNGYGTTKVPLRLGAEPEAHIVTLAAPE